MCGCKQGTCPGNCPCGCTHTPPVGPTPPLRPAPLPNPRVRRPARTRRWFKRRQKQAVYVVPDSPKMLKETLCVAQARIGNSPYDEGRKREHIERLQRLIDECDRHRPVGFGGKHDNLHTPTCGCNR